MCSALRCGDLIILEQLHNNINIPHLELTENKGSILLNDN